MKKIHLKSVVTNSGFTIVELLVVIVVIGILASITIISYMGVNSRAVASSLQYELKNAASILEADKTILGYYPATLELANNNIGLKTNNDQLKYFTDNNTNPTGYCLEIIKG